MNISGLFGFFNHVKLEVFLSRTGVLYDKVMLRKRYVIEIINDLLKNTADLVHSRHRSIHNFLMNLISAMGAYCFFDNKPTAIRGFYLEHSKQLSIWE